MWEFALNPKLMILTDSKYGCDRCKRVVREELEKLGCRCAGVELGEVEIDELPAGRNRWTMCG